MQVDTFSCRSLIQQGLLEEALTHLSNSPLPGTFRNDLILLNGQWEGSERQYSQNLIDYDQHFRDRSRIMSGLLDLLDRMEADFFQKSAINPQLYFFEAGSVLPESGDRKYQTEFKDETTRYVYWEMRLVHPASAGKIEFDLTYELYRPDGSLLTHIQKRRSVETGWVNSFYTNGWGAENPGSYVPGVYTVKQLINGRQVAEGKFTIL